MTINAATQMKCMSNLKKYNLTKMIKDKLQNMNRLIFITVIGFVKKSFTQNI